MAAFATLAAAETRAYAKVADTTWIDAFATQTTNVGTPSFAVRVQRRLNSALAGGEWVEITDDATA